MTYRRLTLSIAGGLLAGCCGTALAAVSPWHCRQGPGGDWVCVPAEPGSETDYDLVRRLRRAICHWYANRYGVELDPEHEAIVTIGSKEGIMHICMTYLNEGDGVLIPNPGYPTYRSAASMAGWACQWSGVATMTASMDLSSSILR